MPPGAHIVITDSGLGGLSICAALEQALRGAAPVPGVRLTFVNAWPFEDRGYNDLPDVASRARVFDGALARMARMDPDRVLLACNTLSVLYPHTAFSARPPVPVHGVIEAGAALFAERLREDPESAMVLIGTKTTIESGAHREALLGRGTPPVRIAAVPCHGLAGAIERDVDGPRTAELIDTCAVRIAEVAPPGGTLFVGLCCTHYGYVAVRIADAVARHAGRRVRTLDPNSRLVGDLLGDGSFPGTGAPEGSGGSTEESSGPAGPEVCRTGAVSVAVVSKVALDDAARRGIARLIESVSPATAAALLSYAHVPDLF